MKKYLSVLLACSILSLGAFAACSQEEPLKDRANGMEILGVEQMGLGSIVATVDLKGATLLDDDDYIQLSTDGGQSWYQSTVKIEEDKVVDGKYAFSAFEYDTDYGTSETAKSYFVSTYRNDYDKAAITFGEKINLSLRFSATNEYNASEGTQPYEYKVKNLSIFGQEMNYFYQESVEYAYSAITSGLEDTYVFEKQQNNSFKIRQFNLGEDGQTTLKDVEPSVLSAFEYKFTEIDDEGVYLHPENHANFSGWNSYDTANGITPSKYTAYIKTESGQELEDGVVIGQTQRRVVPLLVRQKDTEDRCRSAVVLTYLTIEAWHSV